MGMGDILQLAGQFGPMGLMVAYLVWRDTRDDRIRQADMISREKLAGSLALLTAVIQGRGSV
jgi:hypothetical protein